MSAALAGVIAICAFQIRHGTYLGRGWLITAVAGMVTAATVSAATLISSLRHRGAWGRFGTAWLVLGLLSTSSIRYPFPVGPYGSVQTFFNAVHAALLGYESVTCAAILALLAYLLVHPRGLPGLAVLRRPPVSGFPDETDQLPRRPIPRRHGWPGWTLGAALVGLVAGVILAVVGGPKGHDAASAVAGFVILLALATICVAVPAALYRRYRSRRAVFSSSLPGTIPGADPAAQDAWPSVMPGRDRGGPPSSW